MTHTRKPVLHYLALFLSCVAWLITIGAFAYAAFFVSDARAPLAIMSSRTFIQVVTLQFGFLIAVVAFVLSASLLIFSQRVPMVFWSSAISGLYVVAGLALIVSPAASASEPSAVATAREWARLSPLPVSQDQIAIQLNGSSFSREIRLEFKAKKSSIHDWISNSEGLADAEISRMDDWMHYKIKPGGGAQFAKVMVQETSGRVVIHVYWS